MKQWQGKPWYHWIAVWIGIALCVAYGVQFIIQEWRAPAPVPVSAVAYISMNTTALEDVGYITPEPEVQYILLPPETEYRTIQVPGEQLVAKIEPHYYWRTDYKEFESPEAFAEWGKRQPILLISGQDFNTITTKNDCDRQAEFLMRRALAEGYLVSMAPVTRGGYVLDTYVVNTRGYPHVGLWAFIGDNYYYMDSFTHEVVKIQLVRD